jgi:hypothetical protein
MTKIILFILMGLSINSEARVFSYKDSGLAAFVRGTGGLSVLNQDAFGNSSGAGTTVDGKSRYNYGGEVGFMLGLTSSFHVRFGAEVFQNHPVVGDGVDSSGTTRFTLNSSVFVFNPNIAFEYVYKTTGNLRFFGEVGGGYANVTVVNDYKMTSAGTTALGVGDFKETMDTNVISGFLGMGLETLFTDNVTFIIDVGYRYLYAKALKYKADTKNILSPTTGVHKGDPVVNQDGSNRKMNLGGPYGGIAFRFYLNFL